MALMQSWLGLKYENVYTAHHTKYAKLTQICDMNIVHRGKHLSQKKMAIPSRPNGVRAARMMYTAVRWNALAETRFFVLADCNSPRLVRLICLHSFTAS